MKFNDVLKIAFRDLNRRKGRTFLTSMAIAIGSMLIVTMVGLGTTAEKFIMNQLENQNNAKLIQVMPIKYVELDKQNGQSQQDMSVEERKEEQEKSFKKLDDNIAKKLSNLKGAEEVNGVISVDGFKIKIDGKESDKNSFINLNGFINNDYIFRKDEIKTVRKNKKDNNIEPIIAGRSLNNSDKNGVLINENLLKSMGIQDYKSAVGKDITLIQIEAEDKNMVVKPLEISSKIVGVVSSNFGEEYGNRIIIPIDMANKAKSYYTLKKDYLNEKGYDYISISAKEAGDVKKISEETKKLGYAYMSQEMVAEMIKSTLVTVQQILSILGIIVLFVAALGTMNTMTMAIHERTKSIGIMKSIGATRGNIHNIFLTQSATIGIIGGIIGIGFSLINGKIIEFGLQQYLSKQGVKEVVNFSMPMWLILGTLIFAVVVSVISGVYPARKASKLDAVEALNS